MGKRETTPTLHATTDNDDIQAIVEDIVTGLRIIRGAQGYGELVIEIQVRPHGIAQWSVAPAFSRKPRFRES